MLDDVSDIVASYNRDPKRERNHLERHQLWLDLLCEISTRARLLEHPVICSTLAGKVKDGSHQEKQA